MPISPGYNSALPANTSDVDKDAFRSWMAAMEAAANAAAFTLTTKGDILAFSAQLARLPVGADGQILVADNTQATGLKWAAAPVVSPLTTKGDLYTFSNANARLPVGADGQILVADSTQATGLKWVTKREILAANRTYYVRTDGSDGNTGLANTAGGAFLTIAKAIAVIRDTLDLAGFDVTVQLADGTYTAGFTVSKPFVGKGTVTVQGNNATPANVIISTTSADAVACNSFGNVTVKDLEIRTTTSGHGLFVSNFGFLAFSNIRFGAIAGQQIRSVNFAFVQAQGNYAIVGGAQAHIVATSGGGVDVAGRTITLSGTPAFSLWTVEAEVGGWMLLFGCVFSGSATGTRYQAITNGVIHTNGGGASFVPGNAAGSTSTGGQYT